MSVLFWFVAWGAIGLAWAIFAVVGRTPVVEGLFALAVIAGLLGHLADWASR